MKQTEQPQLPKDLNVKHLVLLSNSASRPDDESELPVDSAISGEKVAR